MFHYARMVGAALLIFVAIVPGGQAQTDKVLRALTPEAAEKLLHTLKIDFAKTAPKKGDEQYYDFKLSNYRVRLTYVSPRELMLDCVFRGLPLEKVNQWNKITRLSRVSLHEEASGPITLLEYGLDLSGGVTEGTLKQYVARFEEELKNYDKFILANVVDTTLLTNVTGEKLESILKSLAVNYQKKVNPAGVMIFDFEMNGHRLRLYNFGGADLMMDAHFHKIPLENANRYNLNKKFIRVVNYKAKETEYTALEINLDCGAGVTEGMIRHWILSYSDDVRDFADYAKKAQAETKK